MVLGRRKSIIGFALMLLLSSMILPSCYNFKGISIPPTVSTFYVEQFQNGVGNAPPDIGLQFSENLKDFILRSSRLSYNDVDPSIEFTGSVSGYSVTSVAPEENNGRFGSALNRLNIAIKVDYVNHEDEEENWTQTFSFFDDFDSNTDLASVQDEKIEFIFNQLTEDVFNKTFTNW